MSAERLVRDVIQRVYGDATQTVLDQRAASEIVTAFRAAGWASLDEVAVLIEAAGGSITVPHRLMMDGRDRQVTRQDDFAADGVKFRVSVSDRVPS
jgi:hypothetical protein